MLGKIYTKPGEEQFIANVIKNSLQIDLPKYVILRLAINKSIRLEYKSLDNPCYSNYIPYDGSISGAEYNMTQVIGEGKGLKDYTSLLRAFFMFRHKDENLDFSDDSVFTSTIDKYIHRGLYELSNLYKSKDDFYQFLLDEFLNFKSQNFTQESVEANRIDKSRLTQYFKTNAINAEILSINEALRHDVFKIHLASESDFRNLNSKISSFKREFGLYANAMFNERVGEAMSFNLFLPKPPSNWTILGASEFRADLAKNNKKMIIVSYLGRDINNEPFFFDLSECPHLLIGGASGSGKSVLLHTIITSTAKLNQDAEFIIIDPKGGAEFSVYDGLIKLSKIAQNKVTTDILNFENVIGGIIDEMELRYKELAKFGASKNSELTNPFNNIVVIIDEAADAFMNLENMQNSVVLIAQKARAVGIFVILATQTPNSNIFKQELRANFSSRIALKAQNASGSKIIIDETGAENLLGKGDMLAKVPPLLSDKILLFSPYLNKESIKELLKF
ncbi:FtsK/SpoIIIE domain-containing protein [Campylobacter gastrosuis]|uniref:FtsK/SpoIIIE domain-containing protein n=1 Tax=Campylobacter gastrosuis TaxID=2974576 RepID=A0ABT7HRR4_9BACT|nr:FtsK/SpoIIIE domain-containing protein [Campylobacter gastrosuis]MDL0089575.1 FtsK/SpoIIIE domain-containing protein [Campylobacter gastrosuis]